MAPSTIPTPESIPDYVADGARLGAILFIWSSIAAFFTYGASEVGGPGGVMETLGPQIGGLLVLTGVLNAVLYLLYRTIDYWHASA